MSESQWCTCEHILRGDLTTCESQQCTCKHDLESELTCKWKSCGPLGGHEQGDTGTSSASLAMEHPEAAVKVEVKAGLGEVLSRQQ